MSYELDKKLISECKICNKSLIEIRKNHPKQQDYFKVVFVRHLNIEHNITIEDYLEKYCGIEIPTCPCEFKECGKKLKIIKRGSVLRWEKIRCGRNSGQQRWSEGAKITRRGFNNPMYGKDTWNKGLTKDTNEIVNRIAQQRIGMKMSDEQKRKMSESAKKRDMATHCMPHSETTKELLRQKTLENIKKGVFKQNKSKPFLAFKKILEELNISFVEERLESYWSFDFYLIDYNIYIEVDGDYWHSNPKSFPNGPKTKTQKINWSRDLRKNKYCKENGLVLYRFWECDILNDVEQIKCRLNELLKLKKSA